jgi:hypothetical protein
MSTINNIPFDINRTPSEKNAVAKKEGPNPVFSSEAIHPTEAHNPVGERRKRKERRHRKMAVANERRHLIQRRKLANQKTLKDNPLEKKPGTIIDLEV